MSIAVIPPPFHVNPQPSISKILSFLPACPLSDPSFSESILLHIWCAAAALPDDHSRDWSDHGLEAEGV